MPSPAVKRVLYIVPILIMLVFIVWMEIDPYGLAPQTHEDHWIENLTAIGYGVGGIFFFIAAWRVPLLRQRARAWAPVMTICWGLIGIFCAGEEISWGQRIFHIKTPEIIAEDSTQDEINLHNLMQVEDSSDLSEYRLLSIYMLLGGLGIPLVARLKWGKALVGYAYFPVVPWCYSALWVGAYFYGKYYKAWFPIPDLIPANAATEIRELMVALGTCFFGFHTLMWPKETYIGKAPAPRGLTTSAKAVSSAE
jgi:hypothetical protein